MTFQKVASIEEIPQNTAKCVQLEDHHLAIYNSEGTFYASDNACPHAGGPLGDGQVEQGAIMCPLHGWRFNLDNGVCQTIPAIKVKTYETKVEGNDILVNLE